MKIVNSLKAFGAKLLGVDVSTIEGGDKCEVIDYIAENYSAPSGGMTGSPATVEPLAAPESATAPDIANKVNEIITQLKARGVVL